MQVAERAEPGSVILCMLPDTGERYLSMLLFEPFGADMNEEEQALSRSTPGYQMARSRSERRPQRPGAHVAGPHHALNLLLTLLA